MDIRVMVRDIRVMVRDIRVMVRGRIRDYGYGSM
jgi:hypothetical protein